MNTIIEAVVHWGGPQLQQQAIYLIPGYHTNLLYYVPNSDIGTSLLIFVRLSIYFMR